MFPWKLQRFLAYCSKAFKRNIEWSRKVYYTTSGTLILKYSNPLLTNTRILKFFRGLKPFLASDAYLLTCKLLPACLVFSCSLRNVHNWITREATSTYQEGFEFRSVWIGSVRTGCQALRDLCKTVVILFLKEQWFFLRFPNGTRTYGRTHVKAGPRITSRFRCKQQARTFRFKKYFILFYGEGVHIK